LARIPLRRAVFTRLKADYELKTTEAAKAPKAKKQGQRKGKKASPEAPLA
jgi:hypothetical protein